GDDRLQPPILILECAQLARVTDLHAAVLRPPPVERVLADPVLPAKVSDLLARLRGLQDRDDLLLRESALPHQVLPTTPGGLAPFPRHQLRGAGHAKGRRPRRRTIRGIRRSTSTVRSAATPRMLRSPTPTRSSSRRRRGTRPS